MPNAGKSSLFNALTQAGAQAANYPFTTIEPNVAVVPVEDQRMVEVAQTVGASEIVWDTIAFHDIAGLVAGAHKGEGLGNQFLANIRECDAIAHVVRCFVDDNVIHVANAINPKNDIDVINTELALADLETVEKGLDRATKAARGQDKDAIKVRDVLTKVRAHVDQGNPVRSLDLDKDEQATIQQFHLLTSKPTMYIANVDERGFSNNPYLDQVNSIAKAEGAVVVVICNKLEAEIAELAADDKLAFLQDLGMSEPGLDRVIRAGYELLGLQTYFTAGVKEVRAWTVKIGATAPKAAAVIHTDFEKGFIRAEVIQWSDLVQAGSFAAAREKGLVRTEGKEYIFQDGDVTEFRHGA